MGQILDSRRQLLGCEELLTALEGTGCGLLRGEADGAVPVGLPFYAGRGEHIGGALDGDAQLLAEGVDGLVVGSPVYYAGPNGSLCALLDRLFYSAGMLLSYKPAAAVAVCRRGGASACFDRLNKYFTINNMPVVSSQYWNSVHGWEKGEAEQDAEGLQTMRTLARNMAWMMRNLAKEQRPESEKPKMRTNFV
jgi:multimeric flavodoxin WrbA